MAGGKLLARPRITKLEEDNVRQGLFERERFEAVRSEIQTLEWHQIDFAAQLMP